MGASLCDFGLATVFYILCSIAAQVNGLGIYSDVMSVSEGWQQTEAALQDFPA